MRVLTTVGRAVYDDFVSRLHEGELLDHPGHPANLYNNPTNYLDIADTAVLQEARRLLKEEFNPNDAFMTEGNTKMAIRTENGVEIIGGPSLDLIDFERGDFLLVKAIVRKGFFNGF